MVMPKLYHVRRKYCCLIFKILLDSQYLDDLIQPQKCGLEISLHSSERVCAQKVSWMVLEEQSSVTFE